MESANDPLLPAPAASDDEDDDSRQVLGHFEASLLDQDEGVSYSRPLNQQSPLHEASDPVDGDDDNGPEPTVAAEADVDQDDAGDSDDEEIKKLEAEANVASDEGKEDANEDAQLPKKELIADIFGESDSEDEGFEVSHSAVIAPTNYKCLCLRDLRK